MFNRLFFFFVVLLALLGVKIPQPVAAEPSSVQSDGSASAEERELAAGIDSAIKVAQQEVRDPFAVEEFEDLDNAPHPDSAAVGEKSVSIPTLEGIGFGSVDGYAVLGGDVYYKGDSRNGIKLLEVRRREVDILFDGKEITLSLFPRDELEKAQERAKKKNAI